jgi:hypothetical protein
MKFPSLRTIVVFSLVAAAVSLSACSTSRIVNQWSDPGYTPASFRKVVVMGVSKQASIRRSFEDEFVAQLKVAGIDAVPSYQIIKEEGQADEGRVTQAVKQIGADAAIITRLVRVERRTQVRPGYYDPYPAFGFYRWYSSAWAGYYEPPRAYDYDVYVSETTLYDLRKDRMVWAGTVTTTDSDNVGKEIRNYVRLVIDALKERNLLITGGR